MKSPGHVLAFAVKAVENRYCLGGFFGHDSNIMIFNRRSNRIGYAHITGVARTDNQRLWFGRYNIRNVLGIQAVTLFAPPVTFNLPRAVI